MKHDRGADALSRRIDAVLARRGKHDPDGTLSMEDQRDLDIVRALAAADFSRSSRRLRAMREGIPRAMRRRLSQRAALGPLRRIALRPLPLSIGSAALSVALVFAVVPGGIRGLSSAVADFIGTRSAEEAGPGASSAFGDAAYIKAMESDLSELVSYSEACERAVLSLLAAKHAAARPE